MSNNTVVATSVMNSNDETKFTKVYCESIIKSTRSVKDFPSACQKYDDILEKLEKKLAVDSDPFKGLGAGTALHARASRKKGTETHHQIQRRLTTNWRTGTKLEK